MGTIADEVRKIWGTPYILMEHFAEAIDIEFDALRQEIQDLKTDIGSYQPKMEIDKNGSIVPKTPEPELQRGDFVSYMDGGKKVWGVFHHNQDDRVWTYWQNSIGDFPCYLTFRPRNEITFEFRPEK